MPEQIPKWIMWFLEKTCAPPFLDELQGDLLELFDRDVQDRGPKKARRKLIRRALCSLRWYRLPKLGHLQFVIMYQNYYKVAIRHALKYRSASAIHTVGLMLGLATAFYIGLFIKNELSYDQMHHRGEELYRVLRKDPLTGQRDHGTSSRHGAELAATYPFISMCRFGQDPVKLGATHPILIDNFYWADSTFFQLFDFEFIQGNPVTCLDQVNSLVLTESLSRQLFGTEYALGKSINVKVYDGDQEFPMQVTGIVKDPPQNTHIQFRALGAMDNAEELYGRLLESWFFSWVRTYIRVPDHRIAELEAGIPAFAEKYFGDNIPPDFGMDFQPFGEVYLHSQDIPRNTFRGDIQNMRIFGAIGLLILLVSLLNYVNLATARAVTRSKEVGIRKVLGSRRSSIVGQFIVESILFCLGGGIAALLVVAIGLPYLNNLLGLDISLQIVSWLDGLGILGLLITLGILAGILPALVMSKLPALGRKETGVGFRAGEWSLTRKLFVGIQYFVAMALLVGTIVIYQQYAYLKNFDLGFDADQLIHIPVDDRGVQQRLDLLKERIAQSGGVVGVSATGENMPSELNNTWDFSWPGAQTSQLASIDVVGVDRNYFELLGIDFKEGQNFRYDFAVDSARSVILNEQALQLTGKETLVNQQVNIGGRNRTVQGIVENHHNRSLHSRIVPLAYFIFPPGARVSPDNLLVKVNTKDIPSLLLQLESTWNTFSTDPFKYNFVDEAFAEAYSAEQRFSALISSFALIAIGIALIGLFGLISFIVQLKLKEIGIRRVLGADSLHLIRLLGRDFFWVFVIAGAVALPAAYFALNNWLSNYAYRVDINAWSLAPALLLCLLVSVLVIYYHLRRTELLTPSEVISRE